MKYLLAILLVLVIPASALQLPKQIYHKSFITPESSYATYKQMHKAKQLFRKGKIKEATPIFIRILLEASKKKKEKNIDQYDYLYAHYGILYALEREKGKEREYIKLATKILSYLDITTKKGIWEEGELGQLQMQVYKKVGDHLAQLLYQSSKREDKKRLKQALRIINKSEKYIRSSEDYYIKDTKAKITNALAGNPPLASEKKKIKVVKYIKSTKRDKKLPQK